MGEFLSTGKGLPRVVEHQVQRHRVAERLAEKLSIGNEQDSVVKFGEPVVTEFGGGGIKVGEPVIEVPKSNRALQGNDTFPLKDVFTE